MPEGIGYGPSATEREHGHFQKNRDIRVPQSVIDEIRKLGMAKSIKKAQDPTTSEEFREGVRRFYPGFAFRAEERAAPGGVESLDETVTEGPPQRPEEQSLKGVPLLEDMINRAQGTGASPAALERRVNPQGSPLQEPEPTVRNSIISGVQGLNEELEDVPDFYRELLSNLDLQEILKDLITFNPNEGRGQASPLNLDSLPKGILR